jgi:hypothetical protein
MKRIQIKRKPDGTLENRQALADAFEQIAPGADIIVTIQDAASLPAQMLDAEALVRWYGALPVDYKNIFELQNKRALLSHYYFDAKQHAAFLKQAAGAAEMARKADFIRKKTYHRTTGESDASATAKAEAETIELREAETIAGAEYDTIAFYCDGMNKVLDAIGQHIATLKDERNKSGNEQP